MGKDKMVGGRADGHNGQKDLLYRLSSDQGEGNAFYKSSGRGETNSRIVFAGRHSAWEAHLHTYTPRRWKGPRWFFSFVLQTPLPPCGLYSFLFFFPFLFLFLIIPLSMVYLLGVQRHVRTYAFSEGGFMEIIRACTPPSTPCLCKILTTLVLADRFIDFSDTKMILLSFFFFLPFLFNNIYI